MIRRRSVRRPLFASVLCLVALRAPSSAEHAGDAAPVGATVRRLTSDGPYNWRGATTRALVTTIWYPAAPGTVMTPHDIGPAEAPLFRAGDWADDAPQPAGTFPLIVLSHGTGGSAQMIAWLGRALAARGYIAAAVNHPGNNALEKYTAEGFLLWGERARDLTTVIDRLLADDQFARAIDRRRIGAAGFSLGGATVLELAGGRAEPARLRRFCRARPSACVDPPEFPNLFARWAELEASDDAFRRSAADTGRSHRDPRVRAALAIAPALGPAFVPASLRAITIPVSIVAGGADRIAPVDLNARPIANAIPNAGLEVLRPGVGHYTFLASCTQAGTRALPDLCRDANGVDRDAVHERVAERAIRFFDRSLR